MFSPAGLSDYFNIGVTNDLVRLVYEHRSKIIGGFTRKYNVTRLVYY
jgi:putative endonuclease